VFLDVTDGLGWHPAVLVSGGAVAPSKGGVAGIVGPPRGDSQISAPGIAPAQSCSISTSCGGVVYVSCAQNATPVSLQQKMGNGYSEVAVQSATPYAFFTTYPGTSDVTYRVCNATVYQGCTPDLYTMVNNDVCVPPPVHTCLKGQHWCGEEQGCVPLSV